MRITETSLGMWGCRVLMSLFALPLAVACDPGESTMRGAGLGPSLVAEPQLVAGDEQVCGDASVQELTAGQDIDIGSITISNDDTNLYVTFETDDPWVLGTTHVHVGSDEDDVPKAGSGQPIPGLFDYVNEHEVPPGVTIDTHIIPLADVGLAEGECGVSLYIWAHAEAFVLDEDGGVIQSETAWGGDTPGEGSPRWFFLASYEVQCCEDSDDGSFRTQTQGGWGAACSGDNPGCYRDEWFDTAFPGGVSLGCGAGHTAAFTSSAAVEAFLPADGAPASLSQDHVDPATTEAGVFLGQLLAATLSVGFDAADANFSESTGALADQVLCNTGLACDGTSVADLLSEANAVIGGCGGTLSASELSDCLAAVNQNYVDGVADNGLLCAP